MQHSGSLRYAAEYCCQITGEYELPALPDSSPERGRCEITLTKDAVIILPETSHAIRIPLCFAKEIRLDGYMISICMNSGKCFKVGKMGYDTIPFAERCEANAEKTVAERIAVKNTFEAEEPFSWKGLFRTNQKEEHWGAAFGNGTCAVELYTKDDAATYLYRFNNKELFIQNLEEAMEAVGSHREIIFLSEEQIKDRPLYRMAVHRSEAVRFLRGCSAGRIIHSASHKEKLEEFLNSNRT